MSHIVQTYSYALVGYYCQRTRTQALLGHFPLQNHLVCFKALVDTRLYYQHRGSYDDTLALLVHCPRSRPPHRPGITFPVSKALRRGTTVLPDLKSENCLWAYLECPELSIVHWVRVPHAQQRCVDGMKLLKQLMKDRRFESDIGIR